MSFDCSKVVPKKCDALCCHNVPIDKKIWEKHKNKVVTKEFVLMTVRDDHVIPVTEDLRCPFNNVKDNYSCVIYEDRPPVCENFGGGGHRALHCPYLKPSGNKRGKKKRDSMLSKSVGDLKEVSGKLEKLFKKENEKINRSAKTEKVKKLEKTL